MLDILEKSATELRVHQLNSGGVQISHTFDAAHVKAIHAHLFQDVYDWAGEFRNVDMSKKSQAFADHDGGGIESYPRYATRTIQEQDWKGPDRSGTGEDHNFLPGLPRVHAHGSLTGFRESPDDTMADYARNLIERLNQGDRPDDEEMAEDEPLVEVEDLGDDELPRPGA